MKLRLSFRSQFIRWSRDLIKIDDFTQYLSYFQKIINLITVAGRYLSDVKDSSFLINSIEKGSVDCIIESIYVSKDLEGKDPIEKIIDDFTKISNLIDKGDAKDAHVELSERISNLETRKTLYGYYESIIPNENNSFQIFRKEDGKEDVRIFSAKKRYRHKIKIFREIDSKIKERTFIGVIKNLTAYLESRKHAKIIDNFGNIIQYYYKPDEASKITEFFDKDIIKISGKYNPSKKTITDLTLFEKKESVKLSKCKNIVFSVPIKFQLEYKNGYIYGSNEEYHLYPMGSTYNEMLDDLHNRILAKIEMFSNPEIPFTKSSQAFRNRFLDTFLVKNT